MATREKILGEIGKIGGRIFVSASALRKEVEAISADKLEKLAQRLDLVRRAEFDAVESMLKESRRAQEELRARVVELESQLGVKRSDKKTPSKTGAKSRGAVERKARK